MDDLPGLELVPLMWSVQAMQRALERVRSAGWNDPVGAFAAIGETLWWIGVIDEQMRTNYPAIYDASLANETSAMPQVLNGLRYIRNRITHAVDQVSYATATATNPRGFNAKWSWMPLPPRADGRQTAAHLEYEAVLASKSVSDTLIQAVIFLAASANRIQMSRSIPDP